MKPQTETLLDYLTALVIGIGMAALLVAWWSA
jgi:multisubunit Na+/H+ antiporter MnhC subunit